jgi:hypothetical protein
MKDFTIDVGVLIDGSGRGSVLEYREPSHKLMKKVRDDDEYRIVVDKKGRIKYQYEQKLKQGTFGHHWLQNLASRGKIIILKSMRLGRGVLTRLKEIHFDTEDYKYVETAAATRCKILVSHDPDYSVRVQRVLRRDLDVVVFSAKKCVDENTK